ncbi:F-box-like protein [Ceratobasidium sp. AG-Ba]|nr:F-box-like protein [Ceratobasidium sp. AG-Ba]
MDATPDLFQAWYNAREKLASALKNYQDTSLALGNSITPRSSETFGSGALEDLFTAISVELSHAPLKDEQCRVARAALRRVVNRNTKVVRISVLPDEILVRIFSLITSGRCNFFPFADREVEGCPIMTTTLAITHVCAGWRALAINTPSLWSHLDVVDEGLRREPGQGLSDSLDRLWLERVGNAPLALQVTRECDIAKIYQHGEMTELVPHFENLRSLGVQANSLNSILAMLSYWVHISEAPRALHELVVAGRKGRSYINGKYTSPVLGFFFKKPHFRSLKVLRIRHTAFDIDWFKFAWPPLVHLELIAIPTKASPSNSVLLHALMNLPELQVLKLQDVDLIHKKDLDINTVDLNHLERLELIELRSDMCSFLLSVIRPGPGELMLRLESPIESNILRSFLEGLNVTKLYIKPARLHFLDALITIKDLRTLVIDFNNSFDSCESTLKLLLPAAESGTSGTSTHRWSNLRALWLIESEIEADFFKTIIQDYRPEVAILSLTDCLWDKADRDEVLAVVLRLGVLHRMDIEDWYNRC